ncbi:MAG: ANTAR domain-containing protein [Streptosporangiales bacterium]|nr:ANTAR domain-containing protein [Streptosporangiales bacterium]MBO0889629.1 ANTAR domain-containing protein [Acidothermales bacterium]
MPVHVRPEPARVAESNDTGRASHYDTAALFADVAQRITVRGDLDATFAAVAAAAVAVIDGCDLASISVRRRRRITTTAATDQAAVDVDRIQYRLGDGPCVRAASNGELVVVEDIAAVAAETIAPTKVHAVLSVPLVGEDGPFGSVNMYARTPGAFTDADVALARLYGTHAALAVTSVEKECHLREALDTRETIGQAVGLMMERRRLAPDHAFQVLKRASQDRNVKVRDLARWLVETGDDLRPAARGRAQDEAQVAAPAKGALLRIDALGDGRPGLRIAGELDLSGRGSLAEALRDLEALGSDAHLDLSELRFIDVAGARLLVQAADRLHHTDGSRLFLHRPPPVLVQVTALLLNVRELNRSDPLVLPYSPEPAS